MYYSHPKFHLCYYFIIRKGSIMEKFEIVFKDRKYLLDKNKLIFILSKLENRNLDKISNKEILKLFEKYDLYNEIFLANLNKIW